MKTLQNIINIANDDSLSEQTGMVYQVWDDGEITLQKSGDLLWNRTLHTMKPGISVIDGIEWPNREYGHGFAYVLSDDAEGIRELIKKEAILDIQIS